MGEELGEACRPDGRSGLKEFEYDERENFVECTKDSSWVFRGVADAGWSLHSSLDRFANRRGWPEAPDKALLEAGLLKQFQRKAHVHVTAPPDEGNIMEWLALMQHYGCPTRLLDCTYSFNVALFFACRDLFPLDDKGEVPVDCKGRAIPRNGAIWAFNGDWLKKRSLAKLRDAGHPHGGWARKKDEHGRRRETFAKLYDRKSPVQFVLPQNPHRLNERLVIQQGIFLCPGDPNVTFAENLAAIQKGDTEKGVFKLLIPAAKANKNLRDLHAENMNSAVLFPGLAGFAQSLGELLVLPKLLCPDTLRRIRNEPR